MIKNWLVDRIAWIGYRLYRWALWQGFKADCSDKEFRALIDRELFAVGRSLRTFVDHQASEADILAARLRRRYDPGLALQEAMNRVEEELREAGKWPPVHPLTGESNELTARQKMALRFQAGDRNAGIVR